MGACIRSGQPGKIGLVGCVLLFLLNYAVSGTPTDYRMLPLATDRDVAPAAYYLARMVLLPKIVGKTEIRQG